MSVPWSPALIDTQPLPPRSKGIILYHFLFRLRGLLQYNRNNIYFIILGWSLSVNFHIKPAVVDVPVEKYRCVLIVPYFDVQLGIADCRILTHSSICWWPGMMPSFNYLKICPNCSSVYCGWCLAVAPSRFIHQFFPCFITGASLYPCSLSLGPVASFSEKTWPGSRREPS